MSAYNFVSYLSTTDIYSKLISIQLRKQFYNFFPVINNFFKSKNI